MALDKATWYLGWLGEMRALPTPEVAFTNTEERFGGVHQGLTGKRVMDITGYRKTYEMDFRLLSEDDYRWLRSLYLNFVSPPNSLYLIDPMRKNLLSPQATLMTGNNGNDLGVTSSVSTIVTAFVNDFPTGVALQGPRSFNLVSTSGTSSFIRFDGSNTMIPLFAGVPVTLSMYVRCESGTVAFNLVADCFDKYMVQTTTPSIGQTATTTWQRISYTFTPSGNQVGLRMALVFPTSGTKNLHIAAPQIEYSSSATEWDLGGGRSKVLLDQITSTSPRFPLSDVSVTFLEA
jgi:hypothetical protein